MNVGVTLTSKDVFNEELNLTDCKLFLGSLDQTDVLRLCALLTAVNQISAYEVGGWKSPGGERLLDGVFKDLLQPVPLERAKKLYRTSQHFAPLNGAALSGVTGLACRWCPKDGGQRIDSIEHGQKFVRVLFALQEAMLDRTMVKRNIASIGEIECQRALFPHFARNILANQAVRMEHDLGRLHAFSTRLPEVCDKWFVERFGLSVLEYQCFFTGLSGYAGKFIQHNHVCHLHLRLDKFLDSLNGPRDRIDQLLRVAETTPERLAAETVEPNEMADAVFCIDHLLVYPLLKIGEFHLVTSFEAVFSKFFRGFPYLSQLRAAQDKPSGSGDVVLGARGGFGKIFEAYAVWLTHQRFGGGSVEIIEDYRVQLPGHKKSSLAQRDLLLIRGDVGYALETKAIVPNLHLRKTGDLEEVVRYIVPKDDGNVDRQGLVFQARTAAEALTTGKAFRRDEKTPIRVLRRVFPIGLVFGQLPLRFFNSKPFEIDVAKAYGSDVFRDSGNIAPMQFFDIQAFEEWDKAFGIPSEAGLLFVALEKRAYHEMLRYENFKSARGGNDGLIDKLARESEGFVKTNCKFQKPSSASSGPG